MIATRRFFFISTLTQFTLSYLGWCQQPWMMAHRITFHDMFDIHIYNKYWYYVYICIMYCIYTLIYIYMTCDMSLHVSFWGPDRSTAKTSWHQLRPCISAWWRHLSSRRWQVLVMFRTLSCLDRSENTWCGSKWLQLEMLEKHPVTFSDMPHLTHNGRRLDSLTDIFKAASKGSHQRVLLITTIITIIIIRSILPILHSVFQGRSLWICLWAFLKQTGALVLEFTSMASPIRVSERLWLSAMSDDYGGKRISRTIWFPQCLLDCAIGLIVLRAVANCFADHGHKTVHN